MAVEIKIDGLDRMLAKFDSLAECEGIRRGMQKSVAIVEREAKQKARKKTGALRRSITSKVSEEYNKVTGTVFTPLEYAPFVEFGTGLYAENGDGRKTGWAYEDEKTGETVWTHGQHPQPYLRPALEQNREKIIQLIKEGIMSD